MCWPVIIYKDFAAESCWPPKEVKTFGGYCYSLIHNKQLQTLKLILSHYFSFVIFQHAIVTTTCIIEFRNIFQPEANHGKPESSQVGLEKQKYCVIHLFSIIHHYLHVHAKH